MPETLIAPFTVSTCRLPRSPTVSIAPFIDSACTSASAAVRMVMSTEGNWRQPSASGSSTRTVTRPLESFSATSFMLSISAFISSPESRDRLSAEKVVIVVSPSPTLIVVRSGRLPHSETFVQSITAVTCMPFAESSRTILIAPFIDSTCSDFAPSMDASSVRLERTAPRGVDALDGAAGADCCAADGAARAS